MAEYTATTQAFTCSCFKEAIDASTEEIIGDIKAAIRSAMNKMVAELKSLTIQEIIAIFNVPRSVLNERLKIYQARMTDLEAEIVFAGKSIPLPYFGARQVGSRSVISGSSKKGLRTTARRGSRTEAGPRFSGGVEVQIVQGRTTVLRSAFLASMRSGHVGVFRRGPGKMRKKNKQSIYEQNMVSIATMVNGKNGIRARLVEKVDQRLEIIFWQEYNYFVNVRRK